MLHFNSRKDASTFRADIKALGFKVGPIEGQAAKGVGYFRTSSSFYFDHDAPEGIVAILAHLQRKDTPAERDWLSRQWPDEYAIVASRLKRP